MFACREPNPFRRKFAERLGAQVSDEEVSSGPDERLADVVFDATGNAGSMGSSLSRVAPAGRMVFVGLTRDPVSIDDALFHKREITIYASRNSCNQFSRIIRMMEEGKIDTASWITDRMMLNEVPFTIERPSNESNVDQGVWSN